MKTVKSSGKPVEISFEDFAEKYSFYIPESHKSFYSKADLAAFLRSRYEFFRETHTEIKTKAYNPDAQFLWLANISVIEILMPDSPFIVDTIVDYCNANEYSVQLIIHPIFHVQRENGRLQSLDFPEGHGTPESYVYLEITRLRKQELAQLKSNIEANLKELRNVVTDYEKMMPRLESMQFQDTLVAEEESWLQENFVLLGLSALKGHAFTGRHLGVLQKSSVRENILNEMRSVSPPNRKEYVVYRETEIRSNVNKNRQMYLVLLHDASGTQMLVGHFRHRAELQLRYNIPSIRRMLEGMARDLKVPETSYMRKELYKTAQAMPVGLLLTRSRKFLFPWFVKVVSNMYATEISCDLSIDQEYNLVWAQVLVPVVESGQIPGRQLKRFLKEHSITNLHKFRYQINQIEILFLSFRSEELSPKTLRALLHDNARELFSTWSSRFRELIFDKYAGDALINQVLHRFLQGLSPDYEVHQEPEEVLHDLETLEKLKPGEGCKVSYYAHTASDEDLIKIYTLQQTNLSQLIPILTNFGFTIKRQYAFPYTPDETACYTYMFSVPHDKSFNRADRKRISETIAGALNGRITSRPLNELVRAAGLTTRQLRLMKALCAYFYKISTSHTYTSIQATVVKYPSFSAKLVHLFETRFDPGSSTAQVTRAKQAVEQTFNDFRSVVDENICKALFSIVNAVVRTNYYLDATEIAVKIESGKIDNMPQPVPHFEIYVYAHDMEAIHLRGGAVARGGIRWSDRQDDFRTEILGLMKAQMVKNTVIVPVGSKGGYVVKGSFNTRQEFLGAGKRAYQRFVSCLLDLTDNLSASGQVLPAKGIKRLDGDDPYLVVAADKGTATFSDLANEISLSRKFWLTDAFASGGSVGYDHKKQGITAKGAWEAVKRHFHEMDINPEQDKITAVGIGDMGGDVFGNGFMLSRSVKLIAAFNHLYIFLDPNPDPEKSFTERIRLFNQVLNWDEYDKTLISAGGGVFERSSRKIELSQQVREILAVKARSLSGEELIKAILKAPVDLIWNGGIGTYVKATHETHFQAGDRANDRVRVDASQLRAKVIGEGGNLGLTQAARIEAANLGVRVNTDAIDNSGGVNMSDHEVNLKILLDTLCRRKAISQDERNKIIRKYEPDEIRLVLDQNYTINLGLSLDMRRVPSQLIYFRALIKFLIRKGLINRELDNIPYETELDRLELGSRMLPRPVLCSIAGFAKLYGSQIFLTADEFKDPWYNRFLLRYFPAGIAQKYEKQVKAHPLRREIIITEVLNDIMNHAGIAFFQRIFMATGKSPVESAAAYARLSEFLNLPELRRQIDVGNSWLPSELHYEYLILLEEKIYQIIKKLLKNEALLKLLRDEHRDSFSRMLSEAAAYSSFRLARKLRILIRSFDTAESESVMQAFQQMDILEDTFNVFINNQLSRTHWLIEDYFSVLQQYRVRELRQIIKDIRAASNWEVRFFSKIDSSIESLIAGLIKLKAGRQTPESAERKQRVRAMVNEMIESNERSELSIATFFEMLQYLNERVLA